MDTFQDFNSPFTTTSSSFLPNQPIQDPLTALGSFNTRASAAYSDPSIDFFAQSSQASATAITPPPLFGEWSQTWQQGAGGLPGQAENGFKFSAGQGVTTYQRGDEFGKAVATGDFNGDGYVDLAIGTPGEDSLAYNDDSGKPYDEYEYNGPGQVTIIYGSVTGLSAANSQTLRAGDTKAFGRSLAVGDFNKDGKADLAIGSRSGIGIFNGSSSGLQRGISLGAGSYALTTGDFNGDGASDLAAGDPFNDNEKGSVSIFLGQANVGLTNAASQIWSQDSPGILGLAESAPDPRFNSNKTWGDRFGFSLAAGDFDGDGRDDLAIGAPGERFYMGGISNVPGGAVNVLYGSSSGLMNYGNQFWDQNGTEGSQFNLEGGIESGDQFGYAVKAGDFNGDGIADLAIGVPGEGYSTSASVDDSNGGAVAIIYGKRFQGLTNEGNQLIDQNTPGMAGGVEKDDRFGQSLAVGDVDHNGIADLAVGIPGETAGSKRGGAVAVIIGTNRGLAPTLNTLIDQSQITGARLEDADLFGASLAMGDFDGNGSDDLAIGAPGETVGSSIFNHAGEVNVVYGSKFLPTVTISSNNGVISEASPNPEQFVLTRTQGWRTDISPMTITLKSVGTARLGVDFTVSGASVNGDLVTVQMPQGSIFNQTTPTAFQVTPLVDSLGEGLEKIEFVIVKGDRYTIDPNNRAQVSLQDSVPLVVDTLIDESDNNFSAGDVSLREVIENASNGSTISFAPGLQGTITLDSQLLINKNLTIDGPGANLLSLSGNNTSRVFEIANGATVTLEGLTIANGFANNASGGAIENYGTLTVDNSRVTNNRAVYGGGIHNVGNLTLQNSTVDNNTASYDGGGLYVDMGTVNIYNSTISGNQADYGGGIYRIGGNLTLNHATITNNTANFAGSGLYNYPDLGTTTAKNTLIAGNHTRYNAGGDVYGNVSSQGWNLVGDASGSTGWIYYYDRWGTNTSVIDPKLGALQNNGGTTPTHALLSGSSAIDASSADDLLFEDMAPDQRGIAIQNGRRDIGAVEFTATDALQLGLGLATNPQPNPQLSPQPNLLSGFLRWLELNFPRF